LFYFAIKLSGHEDALRGHITNRVHDERFTDSNGELMRRFGKAVPEAAKLITGYLGYCSDGSGAFAEEKIMDYDFNGLVHMD
ncbi:MAG: hypothetical protein ACI4LM_00785, partial [Anaerovoracaceae bacterium]